MTESLSHGTADEALDPTPPATAGPNSSGPAPRIDEYGLIGNLRTAALISRAGGIDWLCLPTFPSASVFGRLLDPMRGGHQSVAPVERARGSQAYLPSTNILGTTFTLPGGRELRLLDFFPILPERSAEGIPMIVRVVEAVGGTVLARAECEPRFGYGRYGARWRRESEDTWVASANGDVLNYRVPGAVLRRRGRLDCQFELRPGEPVAVEISAGRSRPTDAAPSDLLRKTEQFWLGWVHDAEAPLHVIAGRWQRWLERSELTLKLLSPADSGAFIAAPTTSLPEWPGGRRNWDYRYVWVRDAAFAAEALLLLGHVTEARAFLRWIVRRLEERPPGGPLRVVYGGDPEADLTERTLPLAGYMGSKPVRIGNGAAVQFQLDIYGELLDAADLLSFVDPALVERSWPMLSSLADEVVDRWRAPDRGIWETRAPPTHYVHSKVMAWVALHRSLKLARRFGQTGRLDVWRDAAEAIRSEVLERGYDRDRGGFVQAFGRRALDAANLRIPLVGFLPFDDERVLRTIDRVQAELTEGPFVYRYRSPDGLKDPEGAFLPCSFWLVECLARAGRVDQASQRFEQLLGAAGPLGLLPEEYDPRRGIPLGNYPQALTHIALLRAALALGLSSLPSVLPAELHHHEGVRRLRRALQSPEPPPWED